MGEKNYVADEETQLQIKADTTGILKALQDTEGKFSGIKRYGIKINKADSNPSTRVTYLYDAVGMNPASMNFTEETFDYGDWGKVFFVAGNYPVMLNADGTEAYKLNPDDYSLREDGTASDITDESTTLNAMSAFPKIWLCQYEIGNYEYIIVSDTQVDSSYQAEAYRRADGTMAEKMYMPIYGGSYDGAKLRSLSGKKLMCKTNAQTEQNRAAANGDIWTIIPWSRRNLINCLLMIISKSEDSQGKFGKGVCGRITGSEADNFGKSETGTLNKSGQFYGFDDGIREVKVFHMEKYWGDRWDRLAGYICDKGRIKVKLSPPYNFTGAGYTDTQLDACKEGGYQKDQYMTQWGRFPKTVGASSSTYLCAYYRIDLALTTIAIVGGHHAYGASCDAAFVDLRHTALSMDIDMGASLSCEQPNKSKETKQ